MNVRFLLPTPGPDSLPFIELAKGSAVEKVAARYMPDLAADLGFSTEEVKRTEEQHSHICLQFRGGEDAAL